MSAQGGGGCCAAADRGAGAADAGARCAEGTGECICQRRAARLHLAQQPVALRRRRRVGAVLLPLAEHRLGGVCQVGLATAKNGAEAVHGAA